MNKKELDFDFVKSNMNVLEYMKSQDNCKKVVFNSSPDKIKVDLSKFLSSDYVIDRMKSAADFIHEKVDDSFRKAAEINKDFDVNNYEMKINGDSVFWLYKPKPFTFASEDLENFVKEKGKENERL